MTQPALTAAWLTYVLDPANGVQKPAADLRKQVRRGVYPPQMLKLWSSIPLKGVAMQLSYPPVLTQAPPHRQLSLPPWQWPRADLLAGHWMQVNCTTCEGSGIGTGICGWCFLCVDRVAPVTDHVMASSGIRTWQRYQQADLTTFEWSRLPAHLTTLLQEGIEQHVRRGWGLILTGGVGCGKTHLAIAMGIVALVLGFSVYATTLGELLLAICASFQRETEHSEADLLETVCGADLLILDDLGMEKPTA